MSQDSCPSPPSDTSPCGSDHATSDGSGSSPTLDELISGLCGTKDEGAAAAAVGLEPEAKRARVEERPGTEKRGRSDSSTSGGSEPATKKARAAAEQEDGALEDLTQMKPGAAPSAPPEAKEEAEETRQAASTAVSSPPLVWMYRTAPLYQDAKFGRGKPAVLFEGIDFAFAGEEAREMEQEVVKHGGRVIPGGVLDSCIHPAVYVAGLWGYTPTCMLISSTPQRTLKFVAFLRGRAATTNRTS